MGPIIELSCMDLDLTQGSYGQTGEKDMGPWRVKISNGLV
jgi:hypothetical protein